MIKKYETVGNPQYLSTTELSHSSFDYSLHQPTQPLISESITKRNCLSPLETEITSILSKLPIKQYNLSHTISNKQLIILDSNNSPILQFFFALSSIYFSFTYDKLKSSLSTQEAIKLLTIVDDLYESFTPISSFQI